MPITFPLTPPSAFQSSEITITSKAVVAVSESPDSLVEQVQVKQGQRWSASIKLRPMKRENAEQVVAFLLQLNCREGTFYLGDTANKLPRGIGTSSSLRVDGTATARSNDLATIGWTPNVTGIVKAGDWLQVGSGSTVRLHKILADANSDSSGRASLLLWPKTRSAYASGLACSVTNPVGLFRLASPETNWTVDLFRVYSITVNAQEVL
jgi:hypothetical protein